MSEIDKTSVPAPVKLELEDGQQDQLAFMGSSFWGSLYRSERLPFCYRVFQIDQAPIGKRNAVREWMQRPRRPSVAPIVAAGQAVTNGQTVFFIRYEIEARLTWADLLADSQVDFHTRLISTILVLREFGNWRALLNDDPQQSFWPLPGEILFVEDRPVLLALPSWGQPTVESVFTTPRLGLYLAPEFVRGCESKLWGRNIDLYMLGSAILQAIFEIQQADQPEKILERAAMESLFHSSNCRPRYPFWMEKLDAFQNLLADVKQTVHPDLRVRSGVDPLTLARNMGENLVQLQPDVVIQQLLASDKPKEAFSLVHDILLDNPSTEFLLIAADIACNQLDHPLEAIELQEQAIRQEPANPAAYQAQLELMLTQLQRVWQSMGTSLDGLIWRDFNALPPEQQRRMEQKMVDYLFWRRQYAQAAQFIYPRLFEDGQYAWWKFGMTIAYTRVLIETGRFDEARQQLESIKGGLQRVRENLSLSPQEVHRYGAKLAELEVELLRRK